MRDQRSTKAPWRHQCCGLAACACPTSHTTEKLGVLRDREKWGIFLKKREEQQTGIVSFPDLAPDTVLITSKPPRGTGCPTGHQCRSCPRGNLARVGKVELYPRGQSGAATGGNLGVWDLSSWSRFVHSSGYCPSSLPLMGIWGNFPAAFPALHFQVLQGGSSSTVGDEKPQECLWMLFFSPSFLGGHVAGLSGSSFVPERSPHLVQPGQHQAGGGAFVLSPSGFET